MSPCTFEPLTGVPVLLGLVSKLVPLLVSSLFLDVRKLLPLMYERGAYSKPVLAVSLVLKSGIFVMSTVTVKSKSII